MDFYGQLLKYSDYCKISFPMCASKQEYAYREIIKGLHQSTPTTDIKPKVTF